MEDICPDCKKIIQIGEWPFRCYGRGHVLGPFWTGRTTIHSSERVTILEHPGTGEVRIPGRSDVLSKCEEKYLTLGFKRKELSTMKEIRAFEKAQGKVHESSNYDAGSGRSERDTGSI